MKKIKSVLSTAALLVVAPVFVISAIAFIVLADITEDDVRQFAESLQKVADDAQAEKGSE